MFHNNLLFFECLFPSYCIFEISIGIIFIMLEKKNPLGNSFCRREDLFMMNSVFFVWKWFYLLFLRNILLEIEIQIGSHFF